MILTRVGKENYKYFSEILFLDHVEVDNIVMVGVLEDDIPIAAGALTLEKDSVRIISLYTVSDYRRQGACRLMIQTFDDIAREVGSGRMEIDFAFSDELGEVFEHLGFDVFDSDGELLMSKRTLLSSPRIKRLVGMKSSHRIRSLNTMTDLMKNEALTRMSELGLDAIPKNCDENISAFSYSKNGKFTGALFASVDDEDVYLDLLFGNGKDAIGPMLLTSHFVKQLSDAKNLKTVHVYPNNDKIDNLIYFLADGKKVSPGAKSGYAVRFL